MSNLIPGPGLQDWDARIMGEYYLVRACSDCYSIVRDEDDDGFASIIVETRVVKVATHENLIICYRSPDTGVPGEYWLIDTDTHELWGPQNQTMYEELLEQRGISEVTFRPASDFCPWSN